MMRETPPAWLERALLRLLSPRDRETISGDLLEEYREARLPHSGPLRANLWYLRQVLSFASQQTVRGPFLKQALIAASFFVLAAGSWLLLMENILKHEGYESRSVIAVLIALQGLATSVFVLLKGSSVFRYLVMTGAVATVLLGGAAVFNILRAQHFEGFVLVIGVALLLQGILTLLTLSRSGYRHAASCSP